jgi:hypothetical protein
VKVINEVTVAQFRLTTFRTDQGREINIVERFVPANVHSRGYWRLVRRRRERAHAIAIIKGKA